MEAEYLTSINIHAPMETMNATAMEENGVWHVYTGNQFATRDDRHRCGDAGRRADQDRAASALSGRRLRPAAGVRHGHPGAARCQGGRQAGEGDLQPRRRHDDGLHPAPYLPEGEGRARRQRQAGGLEHDVIGAWPTARWGIPEFLTPSVDKKGSHDSFTVNGADAWYTIPNHTVRNFKNELAQNATPSGQLRSVAPAWTFWAIESMMDEIAQASKIDPVELRLALLDGAGNNAGGDKPVTSGGAKRLANALRTAVGRSGYGAIKLGTDEAMGVACVSSQERSSPTWTACVAQVAVNRATGDIKVKKLTVAMDVGTAINPDGVRAQIEGSTLWGMSIALLEKATMKDGAIQQTNFDGYTPMRMADMPEIDISIISNGEAPVGCGEPAVTVVAPAIANAVSRAVGARVRSLPITAQAVKAAMKA